MSEIIQLPTDLKVGTGKPCAGHSNAKLWLHFASSPCILSTEGNFGTALPTGSIERDYKQNLASKCITSGYLNHVGHNINLHMFLLQNT